nr:uncharacterized protein LOC109235636 isoform X1 [Ipomoea batatas]
MALISWAKKEFARLKLQNPKRISLPPPPSLSPVVSISAAASQPAKDVELAVDLRCANCQKRIATAISNIDDYPLEDGKVVLRLTISLKAVPLRVVALENHLIDLSSIPRACNVFCVYGRGDAKLPKALSLHHGVPADVVAEPGARDGRAGGRCVPKFPAIDLSAISDIDNSFTFARNSDAISTLGIIGFMFSAMPIGLEPFAAIENFLLQPCAGEAAAKAAFLLQPQGWRGKVATDPTAGVNPVV